MFTKHFDNYVCVGDSITTEIDGIAYKAAIYFDEESSVYDAECYTTRQINCWNRNEWFFCGVVISASKNGVEIDDHLCSLWGIEVNYTKKGNEYLLEVANEMLPAAIEDAHKALDQIIRDLTA